MGILSLKPPYSQLMATLRSLNVDNVFLKLLNFLLLAGHAAHGSPRLSGCSGCGIPSLSGCCGGSLDRSGSRATQGLTAKDVVGPKVGLEVDTARALPNA